jgi:hypothetical protein
LREREKKILNVFSFYRKSVSDFTRDLVGGKNNKQTKRNV